MSANEFGKVIDKNLAQIVQLLHYNTYEDHMNFEIEFFKRLIGDQFDINYKVPSSYKNIVRKGNQMIGCTIIHLLTRRPELCEVLIDCGADYTIKDESGSTVLLKEASSDYERFSNSLEQGLFLEHIDGRCVNVILSAHINFQNTQNPIDKNGFSHFHVACMNNRVDVAKFFLENGVSVNESVIIDSTFCRGYSALHFAVRSCALETVELLLTLGADMFAKDSKGMNPLHVLLFDRREIKVYNWKLLLRKVYPDKENDCCTKNERIIYLLLDKMKERGCYLDNGTGLSYFHVLCFMGNSSTIIQLLNDSKEYLTQSVSTESPIWPGFTPLHVAAHSDMETVQLLVEKGADLGGKDASGVTPFDICLREFSIEDVYKILLLQPDYSSIVFSDGKTKLCDIIHAMQDTMTFENLVKNLVNIDMFTPFNSQICAGYTLLHLTIICTEKPMSWNQKNSDSSTLLFAQALGRYEKSHYFSRIESCLCSNPDITSKDDRGFTPLHWAFKLQQSQAVHMLLERHDLNSNPTDEHGLSHLHIACAAGDESLVEKLLSGGANINEVVKESYTWEDIEKVNSTIYYRLNTDYFISKGSTPLHFAANTRRSKIVEILINNGANVLAKDVDDLNPLERLLKTPIFQDSVCHKRTRCVIDNGIKKIIILLLKKIGDQLLDAKPKQMLYCYSLLPVNLMLEMLSQDDESTMKILATVGITKLHVACFTQNVERVNESVEKTNVNASVDLGSPLWPGYTPLHFLIVHTDCMIGDNSHLDTAILNKLLENGANVAAMNAEGDTPIHLIFAIQPYYIECVGKLFEHLKDFSVNPTSTTGHTHLHIASAFGNASIVEKLLKHGALVDQPVDYFLGFLYSRDRAGCTALHLAAARQRKDVVDVLLKHGSDVNRNNVYGGNSLHVAIQAYGEQRSLELLQTLIEAGADIHARDMYGWTPFEILIQSENATIEEIELFLARGIRANTDNPMTDDGLLAIAINKSRQLPIFEMVFKASNVTDIDENGRNAIHNVVSFKRPQWQEFTRENIIQRLTPADDYIKGIDMLIKLGLNIDHQDCKGLTPLHLAAQMQNYTGIVGLLENGADINIPDANGKPAFVYSLELAEVFEEPKDLHLYISCEILMHMYKLHSARIECSTSNREAFVKMRETLVNHIPELQSVVNDSDREVEGMKKEKISSTPVTFYEFLSDTGAVSAFPYMPPCDQMAIASFFKHKTENLRKRFRNYAGILLLQCRKALARVDMIDTAVTSLDILVGFNMPYICSRTTIRFLSNDELINLINATNNER